MTMHLVHPSLSTTGKKKGKQKFRSSKQAHQSRQLKDSWKELEKKWGIEDKKKTRALESKPLSSAHIPKIPTDRGFTNARSLNDGKDAAPAFKSPEKIYTGDQMIGITVLHKSCLQPVFNKEQAVDAAKMRR